jgi:hypothetical protein
MSDPTGLGDASDAIPLPRRSKGETRELMLLAGILIADHAVTSDAPRHLADWLSHIRLERVLEVTKQLQLYVNARHQLPEGPELTPWLREHRERILALDTSAFRDIAKPTAYTVFDGEDDFRERLAERLLSIDRIGSADTLMVAVDALRAQHGGQLPPVATLVSALADVEFQRVRSTDAPFIELGALPFAGNPLIRSLLRRTLEATAYDQGQLLDLYDGLLDAYGWRFRHGYRSLDLFTALSSLVYGMAFHHRVWPESVRDAVAWEDGPRSAFSIAVEGVLRFVAEGPELPLDVPDA